MENVQQIIHRSKVWTDRLKLGIALQNKLAQEDFNISGLGCSKTLEALEKRLSSSENKLQNVQDEIVKVKQEVSKITEELAAITNENLALAQTKKELISLIESSKNERSIRATQLQNKLKTYKNITGVRFDFNNESDNILSGYIAISRDDPSQCSLVPFELDKTNENCSQLLWKKIEEACTHVSDSKICTSEVC